MERLAAPTGKSFCFVRAGGRGEAKLRGRDVSPDARARRGPVTPYRGRPCQKRVRVVPGVVPAAVPGVVPVVVPGVPN